MAAPLWPSLVAVMVALSVAYALIPCLLKLFAIGMLAFLPDDKEIAFAGT